MSKQRTLLLGFPQGLSDAERRTQLKYHGKRRSSAPMISIEMGRANPAYTTDCDDLGYGHTGIKQFIIDEESEEEFGTMKGMMHKVGLI